jgi:hypothetical protein
MDWFGPFEFLALIIFLGSSLVAIALIGSSPFDEKRRAWYRNLWYTEQRRKPNSYTLMILVLLMAIDLGLTGWGAWVTPIRYENIDDSSEAQELVSIWDGRRKFWKYTVIMSLHIVTLFIIPLWMRMIFAWRSLRWSLVLIFFDFILAVLLTVFGYLFYWAIGLGYTFFLTIVTYLMIHNMILFTGEQRLIRSKQSMDEAEQFEGFIVN